MSGAERRRHRACNGFRRRADRIASRSQLRARSHGFGRHERAGVAFEKRHVGAEAADGDLDVSAPRRAIAASAWRISDDLP